MVSASRRGLLSVVIPAFNEAARIGPNLQRVFSYLDSQGCRAEVLVVSDGSADGTEQQVLQLAKGRHDVSVIENGVNRGKGFSVRRGVLEASGSLILFCDADGSTPIEELDKLLAAIDAGCDVAIGSRALPQSDIRQAQPLWRETMGRIFNGFVQVTALPGIRDTQCGFKCFTREAARLIFPRQRIDRFGFDVEVLWLARKLGLRIAEVPVAWIDHPGSTVHPVRDSSRMLVDVVRVRLHDMRGDYGPPGAVVEAARNALAAAGSTASARPIVRRV